MRKRWITVVIAAMSLLCLLPVRALDTIFGIGFTDPGVYAYEDGDPAYYADQGSQTAHVQAWKGDEVYLKLAVHSADAGLAEITVSDLAGDHGTISKEYIQAGYVQKTQASLGTGDYVYEAPHITVPDVITDRTAFEVNSYETEYIWITISVPKTVNAGIYTGSVIVTLNDMKEEAVIELEVLKLAMLEENMLTLDLWQYPYSSLRYYEQLRDEEPFSENHLAVLKDELESYAEMGGNAITVSVIDEPWGHQTYDDYPSMVVWHKSDEGYMWYDYTQFDAWVTLCMECGIDERIDTFSILPWDGAVTLTLDDGSTVRYPLETGSQEWKDVWQGFLYDYMYHLQDKGWLNRTYIFVDERETWQVEAAVELIQSTVIEGEEPLKIAMAVNHVPSGEALYDRVEYLSVSLAAVPEGDAGFDAFLEHRKDLGLETTLYTCSTNYPNSFAISNPAESVWTILYLDAKGFDGFLRWAYDAWTEDPLNSLDFRNFEAGDTLLIYPDEADAANPVPYDSVRLKMLAQGMRETKKIHYLQKYGTGSQLSALTDVCEGLYRTSGNFNVWGSMTAANEQSALAIREQVSNIHTAVESVSKELSDKMSAEFRVIYACE